MRSDSVCAIKYKNIFAVHARQYMCFDFVLQAWFMATSINLWTSDMYDGSNLDKLYIQNNLSVITSKK
jgi:hypothetical protein